MFAAIGLITVGGIMVFSALKGISITDVFAGVTGDPLNAKGGAPTATGGDVGTPPSPATIPGATGDKARPVNGGTIIGVPYKGTHTLGNWQSDNAVDIGTPIGTPVYAATTGTVGNIGLLSIGGSRFAGQRVQIDGPGQSSWYGHLSGVSVTHGQMVRAGQLIGHSGSANGVAHLHFAVKNGDPRSYL